MPDTDLFEAGVLDSLSFVELLVGIEDELGVRIQLDDLDLADVRSIAKLARLVARQGTPP